MKTNKSCIARKTQLQQFVVYALIKTHLYTFINMYIVTVMMKLKTDGRLYYAIALLLSASWKIGQINEKKLGMGI